jgi:PAS domain S-box-containing protein
MIRTKALSTSKQTPETSRFETLVQSVTDYAIYMLDPDGIITSWNAGAQRFKGYTPEEIIGEHFSRFYGEDDLASGLPERALAMAAREDGLKRKAGASARMARASGPMWCWIASRTPTVR